MNNWSALPNGTKVISTVMFGLAASKSLTALVKVSSSLLSAANVCHTSIVIGPSSDVLDCSSVPPKSKQPGMMNSAAIKTNNILRGRTCVPSPPNMHYPRI